MRLSDEAVFGQQGFHLGIVIDGSDALVTAFAPVRQPLRDGDVAP